jgi:hypothetical protein
MIAFPASNANNPPIVPIAAPAKACLNVDARDTDPKPDPELKPGDLFHPF